jgi:putative transcriptional regulator
VRNTGWTKGGLTGTEMIRVSQHTGMDETTRAALASGRADPAMRLFLETLMEMRGITEAEGDALGGALLEAEAPAAMSATALDRVFASIERGGQDKPRQPAYPELAGLPAGLRAAMLDAEQKRRWKTIGPGIRQLDLIVVGGVRAEIIRLEAGKSVPRHTHKGRELTLCVHGEYSDGTATYGPGDFSVKETDDRHQPQASAGGPAYALAVTDAGLRFEGLLGALQKLIGQ